MLGYYEYQDKEVEITFSEKAKDRFSGFAPDGKKVYIHRDCRKHISKGSRYRCILIGNPDPWGDNYFAFLEEEVKTNKPLVKKIVIQEKTGPAYEVPEEGARIWDSDSLISRYFVHGAYRVNTNFNHDALEIIPAENGPVKCEDSRITLPGLGKILRISEGSVRSFKVKNDHILIKL